MDRPRDFHEQPSKAEQIAQRNDHFRCGFTQTRNFRVCMTSGVSHLGQYAKQVVDAVRAFDSFDLEDDPYGEHDFGKVTVGMEDYFFKIDYYAPNMEEWGDPLDDTTVRVMTIMRTDEY